MKIERIEISLFIKMFYKKSHCLRRSVASIPSVFFFSSGFCEIEVVKFLYPQFLVNTISPKTAAVTDELVKLKFSIWEFSSPFTSNAF